MTCFLLERRCLGSELPERQLSQEARTYSLPHPIAGEILGISSQEFGTMVRLVSRRIREYGEYLSLPSRANLIQSFNHEHQV